MKNKNRMLLLCLAGFFLCLAGIFWLTGKQREEIALIDKTGVETIGTVIHKAYARQPNRMIDYSIHFDLLHEGTIIQARNMPLVTEEDYQRAIVGRKYKVKYLPKSPKVARIYLDEPVYSEDVNIEAEKERILRTYNY